MNLSNHDYIELKKELEVNGLLKKTPLYYLSNFLVNALLLISLFSIALYFNRWDITILALIPLALVFMQFAYLGHDAGHMAISKNMFPNELVGHFTHSFLLGGSFSYWRFKHNNHHAYPNHEDFDPDLNNRPFSLSEMQAKQRTGFSNFITRFQSFLLPPVFLIMLFLMRWDSVKYMLNNRKGIFIDALLILSHFIFFLIVIPYFIGFLKAIVLYIVLSVLLGLHFGFSFIPNHVGMPTLMGNENLSFLEEQVVTSRNIKGGFMLDIVFGGLNYQIEHHIFPNISRRNLPKIKASVKNFCTERGIKYKDDTLKEAWMNIFIYLNEIGKQAKRIPVFKTASGMV